MKLVIDSTSCFGVKVANSEVIRIRGECKAIQFKMQGLELKVNFNLLSLGDCDIILGTQWLSTLGMISWDFSKLLMGVLYQGKKIWLKGLKTSKLGLQESKQFGKGATAQGLLLQIMQCSPCQEIEVPKVDMHGFFGGVPSCFWRTTRATTQERHEHQILLKEGAKLTSQRPYRYPFYQKSEIEKIVKDLLESGCIRPSLSPFASSVLLVRKAYGSWRICIDYRG